MTLVRSSLLAWVAVMTALAANGSFAQGVLRDGNGHIDARIGSIRSSASGSDNELAFGGSGAWLAPIRDSFATQIEGSLLDVEGDTIWVLGAKVLHRDPLKMALGVGGWFGDVDGHSCYRIGVLGERFLSNFTFGGALGATGADWSIKEADYDMDDQFFADIDATWYPKDVMALRAGISFVGDSATFDARGEWQLPPEKVKTEGLSFFAEASIGNHGFQSVFAGIRWNPGERTSLKALHRNGTQPNTQLREISALLNYADNHADKAWKKYQQEEAQRKAQEEADRLARQRASRQSSSPVTVSYSSSTSSGWSAGSVHQYGAF